MTGEEPLAATDLDSLLDRCSFPAPGTPVTCGLSGGADSSALIALAARAGLSVTAVHVHHGLRAQADADADAARTIATRLDVAFRCEYADVSDGPNLEERARLERRRILGDGALLGHTADDQAETVLLALLRGSGARGLAGIRHDGRHPLLGLRRSETESVCDAFGLAVVDDSSNRDPRFRRNRVRHELVPLLRDIAERDPVPLLVRAAALLRDDDDLLDELAATLDPTDAKALATASAPLARRAVRAWLRTNGHPPDSEAVARVLEVAAGNAVACEISGGRRVERSHQRLRLLDHER